MILMLGAMLAVGYAAARRRRRIVIAARSGGVPGRALRAGGGTCSGGRRPDTLSARGNTAQDRGDAEWQCGRAGPAILAWEQAQWLEPFNRNAASNLRLARHARQLDAPEPGLVRDLFDLAAGGRLGLAGVRKLLARAWAVDVFAGCSPERFNWVGRACSILLRKRFVVCRLQIAGGYARGSRLALRKSLLRNHLPPN